MIINVTADAMKRMFLYARHSKGEVSGLGDVIVKDGELTITNVYIFPQECSGGETDMDWEAVTNFLSQFKAGSPEAMAKRLWWHSHADMQAFFSGTDKDTIISWGKQGVQYLVSICVNKKREVAVRYDVFKPVHLYTDKCNLWVMDDENDGLYKETQQQVAKLVREKKCEPARIQYGSGRDDNDWEDWEWVEEQKEGNQKFGYYRKRKGERKSMFSHLPEEDKKDLYDWFETQEWRDMPKKERRRFLEELGMVSKKEV